MEVMLIVAFRSAKGHCDQNTYNSGCRLCLSVLSQSERRQTEGPLVRPRMSDLRPASPERV